jgi:hypothetical protein
VGAYLGLVAGKDQSGESDPSKGISGEGDEMLRRLVVSSAHYILGPFAPDSDLRRHGQKIASGGGKNAKKRAVMHGFRGAVGRSESLQRLHHDDRGDHLREAFPRLRLAQVPWAALGPRSSAPERAMDNPSPPVGQPGASVVGRRKERQSRAGADLSGPTLFRGTELLRTPFRRSSRSGDSRKLDAISGELCKHILAVGILYAKTHRRVGLQEHRTPVWMDLSRLHRRERRRGY